METKPCLLQSKLFSFSLNIFKSIRFIIAFATRKLIFLHPGIKFYIKKMLNADLFLCTNAIFYLELFEMLLFKVNIT